MTQDNQWMRDPSLKGIPIQKLEFLEQMLFQSKQYKGKELMPFFMSLAMKSRSQNISFSEDELELLVPVLKKYASEDEVKKMNQVITMFKKKNS